ncbi:MAG: uncharacterized protein A8A55_3483, partial [Amphiamblys sp. WSBS2006]
EEIYPVRDSEIEEVISECRVCDHKGKRGKKKSKKTIIEKAAGLRYQADLIDLSAHKDRNDGYCWVLNVVDVYSRYEMAVALKSKSAVEVKQGFERLFSLYDEPRILQTDNGGEFINASLEEWLEGLKVRLVHGLPRRPQTQGKIERINGTLKEKLALLLFEAGSRNDRWIDVIQRAVKSYNRTHHTAHGKTPYRKFFGRRPNCSHP